MTPGHKDHDGTARGDALDAGFAALRADAPAPRRAFVESVMADALAEMPRAARRPSRARAGGIAAMLGGWRGIAAVGMSALAGLSIGYLDPGVLDGIYATQGWTEAAADIGYDEPLLAELSETLP